jgi:hypothetical protein
MKKRPQPRFKASEEVRVHPLNNQLRTIKGEPVWNGFTWMYSFYNEDLSCGEMYLARAPKQYVARTRKGNYIQVIDDLPYETATLSTAFVIQEHQLSHWERLAADNLWIIYEINLVAR